MPCPPGSPPKERPVPSSTDAAAVCSAAGRSTAVCTAVYRLTGNTFLAQASDAFIVRPFRVLLIVTMALIANRVLRSVITRAVRGLRAVHHRPGADGADEVDLVTIARRIQ